MAKKSKVKRIIPELQDQIRNVMHENQFRGFGAETIAQKKVAEYCSVGRKAEKMFENMTFGLYKDRRKQKELL